MVRIFRHYVPKSLILLTLIEAIILIGAPYVVVDAWNSSITLEQPEQTRSALPQAFIIAFFISGTMLVMGLYWHRNQYRWIESLWRIAASFAIALTAVSLLIYVQPGKWLDYQSMKTMFAASFLGVVLTRLIYHAISKNALPQRRVLVLGVGKKAQEIEREYSVSKWKDSRIVSYIGKREGSAIKDKSKIHENVNSVSAIADVYKVTEIVVAQEDRRNSLPMNDILECKLHGIDVLDAATFLERMARKINVKTALPSTLIFADGYRIAALGAFGKRSVDVAVSAGMLAMTWPIMVLTALAIYIGEGAKGPILYRQKRIGRGGQIFEVLKFRSMRVDAEKNGSPVWAKVNDDRVTRIGGFIRKYRIDELPQLFNVLRGDMSLVGPRPERPEFVERLELDIPYYNLRHCVKPGITGWAQICYPYGDSVNDAIEKLQYDLYYIKNYSIFLDFNILLQTAQAVLWGKGGR